MNAPNSPESEAGQQFLAKALAAESRLDPAKLPALLELQKSVATGKIDLPDALAHIADVARNVANASGIAVALFDGDQLTYWAGSGSCSDNAGWPVTASLPIPETAQPDSEILRIENAETATGTNLDLCWHLGAKALLILPIFYDHGLGGILEIGFGTPHVFEDAELRAYRWLTEQIEAALVYSAQLEPQTDTASGANDLGENRDSVAPPDFLMLPENEQSFGSRCAEILAGVSEILRVKQMLSYSRKIAATTRELTPAKPSREPRPRPTPAAAKEYAEPAQVQASESDRTPAVLSSRKPILALPKWRPKVSLQPLAAKFAQITRKLDGWGLALAKMAASVEHRIQEFNWPKGWHDFCSPALLRLAQQLKQFKLREGWHNFANAKGVASLSERAKNLAGPKSPRHFDRATIAAVLRERAKDLKWSNPLRDLVVVGIGAVLTFTVLTAYQDRNLSKSVHSSVLPASNTVNAQVPTPKPLPGKDAAVLQPVAPSKQAKHANRELKRVRVGPNEVDYVADDVTVRTFSTQKPVTRRRPAANSRETKIGDDVTVRYFTPQTASKAESR